MLGRFGVFLARAARDFFKDFGILGPKMPKFRSSDRVWPAVGDVWAG